MDIATHTHGNWFTRFLKAVGIMYLKGFILFGALFAGVVLIAFLFAHFWATVGTILGLMVLWYVISVL